MKLIIAVLLLCFSQLCFAQMAGPGEGGRAGVGGTADGESGGRAAMGGPAEGGPVDGESGGRAAMGGPAEGGPVQGGPVDGGPVQGGPVDSDVATVDDDESGENSEDQVPQVAEFNGALTCSTFDRDHEYTQTTVSVSQPEMSIFGSTTSAALIASLTPELGGTMLSASRVEVNTLQNIEEGNNAEERDFCSSFHQIRGRSFCEGEPLFMSAFNDRESRMEAINGFLEVYNNARNASNSSRTNRDARRLLDLAKHRQSTLCSNYFVNDYKITFGLKHYCSQLKRDIDASTSMGSLNREQQNALRENRGRFNSHCQYNEADGSIELSQSLMEKLDRYSSYFLANDNSESDSDSESNEEEAEDNQEGSDEASERVQKFLRNELNLPIERLIPPGESASSFFNRDLEYINIDSEECERRFAPLFTVPSETNDDMSDCSESSELSLLNEIVEAFGVNDFHNLNIILSALDSRSEASFLSNLLDPASCEGDPVEVDPNIQCREVDLRNTTPSLFFRENVRDVTGTKPISVSICESIFTDPHSSGRNGGCPQQTSILSGVRCINGAMQYLISNPLDGGWCPYSSAAQCEQVTNDGGVWLSEDEINNSITSASYLESPSDSTNTDEDTTSSSESSGTIEWPVVNAGSDQLRVNLGPDVASSGDQFTFEVFTLSGRLITTHSERARDASDSTARFSLNNLAQGVYLLKITRTESNGRTSVRTTRFSIN